MKSIEHLGTIKEIRKEFDKTIAMGCREDRWYMLLGGNKDISNHDVMECFSMFAKYTIELFEKNGGNGERIIDDFIDYMERCRTALLEKE